MSDERAEFKKAREAFIERKETLASDASAAFLAGWQASAYSTRDQNQIVYVILDRVCEADILVGIFSTREKAQAFLKAAKPFRYESPEIVVEEVK